MSDTNFMSYTDAQSVLGGFANAIKGKDDPYTTISYADWLNLTDQEKESGKYYITGAPGADGSIQVDLMVKLWENPSPTAEFAAQDITLNSSDYDLLIIIYKRYAGGNIAGSLIIPKNESIEIEACSPESSGARTHTRQANVSSNGTIISWGSSYMTTGTSSYTVNNNGCVPTAIYGIKTTQTIRLNAIAKDVSTSADKCMLSDGETSVENAIEGISKFTVHRYAVGSKTFIAGTGHTIDISKDYIPLNARCITPFWNGYASSAQAKIYFTMLKSSSGWTICYNNDGSDYTSDLLYLEYLTED